MLEYVVKGLVWFLVGWVVGVLTVAVHLEITRYKKRGKKRQ